MIFPLFIDVCFLLCMCFFTSFLVVFCWTYIGFEKFYVGSMVFGT